MGQNRLVVWSRVFSQPLCCWALPAVLLLVGCPSEPPINDDDDDDTTPAPVTEPGLSLLRSPVQITSDSSQSGLLGHSVVVCDFDLDGRDDLVLASPEAAGGHGRISIFYGKNSDGWDSEMVVEDAELAFNGDLGSRLGYGVACDDFDGDGWMDIAAVKARWFGPAGDEDFAVAVWHGGKIPWEDAHPLEDAGLVTSDLGVPSQGFGGKAWLEMTSGDLDGDGAAEIVLIDRWAQPPGSPVVDQVYVLPGQRWEGTQALQDVARATLSASSPGSLQGGALLIADLDNEAGNELLIGEPFSGPMNNHLGRVSLLRDPTGEQPIASAAYAVIDEPGEARAFGEAAAAGDFDGDGQVDLAVGGVEENIEGPEPHGSVWIYLDAASLPGSTVVNSGDGHVAGDPLGGYLGMDLHRAEDRDGDGKDELLVVQPDLLDVPGTIWLFSGGQVSGTVTPEDVEITRWRTAGRGSVQDRVAVGDFDGDGTDDYVIGSPQWEERTELALLDMGRVDVVLSSREVLPEVEATNWVAAAFQFASTTGPVGAITLTGPDGTSDLNGFDGVLQVDQGTVWELGIEASDCPEHRLISKAGHHDSFQRIKLWTEASLSQRLGTQNIAVDATKGQVVVSMMKRDGSGATGGNVDIDLAYEFRGVQCGEQCLSPDSEIPPGPAENAFVLFANVSPGDAALNFELDKGESCHLAPGGQIGEAVPEVRVEPGVVTLVQVYCKLNRF